MKLVLIVIAIVLTVLLCWINIRAAVRSSIWIHAGPDLLLLFGIIALLHGILLFLLIVAQKLPLIYMLMVWGILVSLYVIPPIKSHLNRIAQQKQRERKEAAQQRVDEGMATIDDFTYLYGNDSRIFINALKHGYHEIAKEILAIVCEPSSNRLLYKEYGHEVALQKTLGWWLIRVVENELPEGCKLLLAAGADVNMMTESSPLLAAAKTGQLELVRLLVQHGADVNKATEHGTSPLMVAVSAGADDVAHFLLEHGADKLN